MRGIGENLVLKGRGGARVEGALNKGLHHGQGLKGVGFGLGLGQICVCNNVTLYTA